MTTTALRTTLHQALLGFEVPPDTLTDQATFAQLGMDSLALVELIDTLSAELQQPLADDTLNLAMTLEQAVAALAHGGAA